MSTGRSVRLGLGVAAVFAAGLVACGGGGSNALEEEARGAGCPGSYPALATSPYVLPWAVGQTASTGLTNCSTSFHAAGQPDQYAFDFKLGEGTPFTAAREGTVIELVDTEPSNGGGSGNFVAVDHGDGSIGLYLHSPQGGIRVAVGDRVSAGQVLGVVGRSGLAGFPHLHFIVVLNSTAYPYRGQAVSFRNASPADQILRSEASYTALSH
jgi:murein DD-endopeptidase MepM/ murein hydrolase activator NlpD